MSKKKYPGVLGEQMVWHAPTNMVGALLGHELTKDEETANEKNLRQLNDRLKALYDYFGIVQGTPNSKSNLIYALACAHVPGFKWKDPSKRGVGKPNKWQGSKSAELYADVKYIVSSGKSVSNACQILASSPKYAARYQGETQGNLHKRYYDAPTKMDSLLRTLMIDNKQKGAPFDEWMIEVYSMCGKS